MFNIFNKAMLVVDKREHFMTFCFWSLEFVRNSGKGSKHIKGSFTQNETIALMFCFFCSQVIIFVCFFAQKVFSSLDKLILEPLLSHGIF